MARRFSSRRRFVSRVKRNAERNVKADSSTLAIGTQQVAYTYTAAQAGVVKSIRLDTGAKSGSGVSIPYTLVVVREGYNANTINYPAVGAQDLYNPTMDILICGILTDSVSEDHKFNSIGRKLKTGDRLALIYRNAGTAEVIVEFTLEFSFMT